MTWRTPPFDRAIAQLETFVRSRWKPLGIVVSGSIIRGEAGPTSDFDVVIVHDQPWRQRDQRRFGGVPAELFVNPPAQIRRYFANGHKEGKPDMAHMLATGEVLGAADPVIDELVREARDWLTKPFEPTPEQLTSQRYGVVDLLDNVRDVIASDPPAAALLLADAVQQMIAHAFWRRGTFEPRRKAAMTALAALDPGAADLVRRWAMASGHEALAIAEALAHRVVEADTFFEWTSAEDPVAGD